MQFFGEKDADNNADGMVKALSSLKMVEGISKRVSAEAETLRNPQMTPSEPSHCTNFNRKHRNSTDRRRSTI